MKNPEADHPEVSVPVAVVPEAFDLKTILGLADPETVVHPEAVDLVAFILEAVVLKVAGPEAAVPRIDPETVVQKAVGLADLWGVAPEAAAVDHQQTDSETDPVIDLPEVLEASTPGTDPMAADLEVADPGFVPEVAGLGFGPVVAGPNFDLEAADPKASGLEIDPKAVDPVVAGPDFDLEAAGPGFNLEVIPKASVPVINLKVIVSLEVVPLGCSGRFEAASIAGFADQYC